MNGDAVQVKMFGDFIIFCGDLRIDGSQSYRSWPILAYLIFYHDRSVAIGELIRLISDGNRSGDPENFLRLTIHRLRRILEPVRAKLGKELIVTGPGAYRWNPDVPLTLDAEEFEALIRSAGEAEDPAAALPLYRKALDLYADDLLPRFSGEIWVTHASSYYRELYFNAALSAADLFLKNGQNQDAETACQAALRFDPYNEPLTRTLMRAYMASRSYAQATETYKQFYNRLYEELGASPDDETQALFREIQRRTGDTALSLDDIKNSLKEANPVSGALLCRYDEFCRFYQAEARSAARRGDAIHIAIISVTGKSDKKMSATVLRNTMLQLETLLQTNLRTGDIAAACSASQYILMLVQANFENSGQVLERVTGAFYRAHPHTTAYLQYTILPIDPAESRRG